jgi:hypothetical protein
MNGSMSDAVRFVVKQKLEDDEIRAAINAMEERIITRMKTYEKCNEKLSGQVSENAARDTENLSRIVQNQQLLANKLNEIKDKEIDIDLNPVSAKLKILAEDTDELKEGLEMVWDRVSKSFFKRFKAEELD